jgi:hypothetical protein
MGFVWDALEREWEDGFAALTMFKTRNGHCHVPNNHKEGSIQLGKWVWRQRQRAKRENWHSERRLRLNDIGFIWGDKRDVGWEKGFAALIKFKERTEHCRVPPDHIEGTFRLASWVRRQRACKDTMTAERRHRLEELGLLWNALDDAWEEAFTALKGFKARVGHCRVPQPHVEGKFWLGDWVLKQRRLRESMPAARKLRLEEIGFVWNPYESLWEKGFVALSAFKARTGHCRVHPRHREGSFNLGTRVRKRRISRNTMSAEHRRQLEEIGFVWDPLEDAWEEGFASLMIFKAREGHCGVPRGKIESTFKLGSWVSYQRKLAGSIPRERRQRLDEIGFVWSAK